MAALTSIPTESDENSGWGSYQYQAAFSVFEALERLRAGGDPRIPMRHFGVQITFGSFNRDPKAVNTDFLEAIVEDIIAEGPEAMENPVKRRLYDLFNGVNEDAEIQSFEELFDIHRNDLSNDLWGASRDIFQTVFIDGMIIYNNPDDAAAIANDENHHVNVAMRCWLLWVLGLFFTKDHTEIFGGFAT